MENEEFDKWNIIKQKIESKQILPEFNYNKRDIWWCSIGKNIGTEMNGKNLKFERPVLIFKPINRWQFFGIPLSSNMKNVDQKILFLTKENILKCGSAKFSQLRVFSTKRLIRKIGFLEQNEYIRIKEIMFKILN